MDLLAGEAHWYSRTAPTSAGKSAVQAADLSLWIEPLEEEEWPHRELRLGFDTQARLPPVLVCHAAADEDVTPVLFQ